MRETLLALAYPLLLSASGVYAGCSCWWRRRQRRRGVAPSDVHPVAVFRRSRLWVVQELETTAARLDAVRAAEAVVREADARLGPLYEPPASSLEPSVVVVAELIVEAEHARSITER